MALSSTEQELFEHGINSLPRWMRSSSRLNEDLQAAAKVIGAAFEQGDHWLAQTRILTAVGPVGDEPDYLRQHARDRGTDRLDGETDPALRDRIRNIEDAVTRPAILAAAQAIVDEEEIEGTVVMVEHPRDSAYFLTNVADAGTGGTFDNQGADGVRFLPDTDFACPPFRSIEEAVTHKLKITGANDANNDGTFEITGLDGDQAAYTNALAVSEADPGVAWEVERYDRDGNLLTGFQDSYLSRGDRFQSRGMVLILPYGSTELTEEKVYEMLRLKKAAGVKVRVERRLVPEDEDMAFLPESWEMANVAASLTDETVEAAVSTLFAQVKMDRAGSIVALVTQLDDTIAAGTLTVYVTKNGTQVFSGAHSSGSNSTGGVFTQDAGTDTYAAGDLIGVEVTTSGTLSPAGSMGLRVLVGVLPA